MKINKNQLLNFIFSVLVIIIIFKIPYLSYVNQNFDKIYKVLELIIFVISVILIISQKKIGSCILYLLLFVILIILSSMIKDINFITAFSNVMSIISTCIIFDFQLKKHNQIFLNSIIFVLIIYFIINFISILLFPKGIYINSTGYSKNWILGYKNSHILYIYPLILCIYLKSLIKNNKINLWCYVILFLGIISSVLVNNSTAILSLFIIFLSSILYPFIKEKINIKYFCLISIGLFFLIIIFRFQNIFSFILVDILGKDITFTGRTYVWDSVQNEILQSPIIGYGVNPFVYVPRGMHPIYSTHNFILDIIYKSGLCGITIFMMFCKSCLKKLYVYKDTSISKYLSIFIFSFSIMMLTESYPYVYTFYLFIFCYNCNYFLVRDKNEN